MSQNHTKNHSYPSDLTDEQWREIEPLVPAPRHKTTKGGRPRGANTRDVADAILYMSKTGCQWRMVPNDFRVKWQLLYHYYRRWKEDGVIEKIESVLRRKINIR